MSEDVKVIFHFISGDKTCVFMKKEKCNSLIETTNDNWDITVKNPEKVINMQHVTYFEVI